MYWTIGVTYLQNFEPMGNGGHFGRHFEIVERDQSILLVLACIKSHVIKSLNKYFICFLVFQNIYLDI